MNLKSLTLITAATSLAASASAVSIITDEHVDLGIGYKLASNEWDLHLHDETNDIEYEPGDAILQLGPNAMTTAGAAGSFLGVGSGHTIWRIRENPIAGVPYLGVATEETDDAFESYTESDPRLPLIGANPTGEWATLQLKGFSGPGNFAIWSNDGPTLWVSTADGIGATDKLFIPDQTHQHFNFAFSEAGDYAVTFEASAIINGQRSFSGDVTYNFQAVPEPGTMAALGLGAAALLRRRRR